MDPLPLDLAEAAIRLERAADEFDAAYQARRAAPLGDATPAELVAATLRFFAIAAHLEREGGTIEPDQASELGDHGLRLLADVMDWARRLDLAGTQRELALVTLAAADWITRHGGELRSPEPIVNAAADYANRLRDPAALEALAGLLGRVIAACAPAIKHDLEAADPMRPWRLLHLNRAIVATRSHNPSLMEQVFDELVAALPQDAPRFFAEGMEQMEALDYPPEVRDVMRRYFDAWTRRAVH